MKSIIIGNHTVIKDVLTSNLMSSLRIGHYNLTAERGIDSHTTDIECPQRVNASYRK